MTYMPSPTPDTPEEEKKITLWDINEQLKGIKQLIEDRTAMLSLMFKQDQYEDFLMAEKAQTDADLAGRISAGVQGAYRDLSPAPMMPDELAYQKTQLGLDAHPDDGGPSATEGGDLSDINRRLMENSTQKFNKGGVLPSVGGSAFAPADNTSSQSLAETGFNDTFEKNISTKLEDDFQIDQRLKDAFGASLALPMRAAAVGLMQIFKMIPSIGIGGNISNIVNNSLNSISNAFGISSENVLTTSNEQNNLLTSVTTAATNFLGGGNRDTASGGRSGGASHNSTSPGHVGGSGRGTAQGGFPAGLFPPEMSSMMTQMETMAQTMKPQMETMGKNLSSQIDKEDPLGSMMGMVNTMSGGKAEIPAAMTNMMPMMNNIMTNVKSGDTKSIISSVINESGIDMSSVGPKISQISELTNTVINEGSKLMQSPDVKEAISNIQAQTATVSSNMEMESGFKNAISDVKQISDVFQEYANTAQFL